MAGRLSIPNAATQAWRDVGEVLRALMPLALTALLISMMVALARLLLVPSARFATAALLVEFIFAAVRGFLLTPYLIAVHRFVILREQARGYAIAPRTHRFELFFLWSMALSLFYWIPLFASAALERSLPLWLSVALLAIVIVVATTISFRLVILFPAVAVDAPGATWQNAMEDTKGHVWRILFISLLAAMPVGIGVLVLFGAALQLGLTLHGAFFAARVFVGVIVTSLVSVLGATLAVAIASRLYEVLGDRVNRG